MVFDEGCEAREVGARLVESRSEQVVPASQHVDGDGLREHRDGAGDVLDGVAAVGDEVAVAANQPADAQAAEAQRLREVADRHGAVVQVDYGRQRLAGGERDRTVDLIDHEAAGGVFEASYQGAGGSVGRIEQRDFGSRRGVEA